MRIQHPNIIAGTGIQSYPACTRCSYMRSSRPHSLGVDVQLHHPRGGKQSKQHLPSRKRFDRMNHRGIPNGINRTMPADGRHTHCTLGTCRQPHGSPTAATNDCPSLSQAFGTEGRRSPPPDDARSPHTASTQRDSRPVSSYCRDWPRNILQRDSRQCMCAAKASSHSWSYQV